MRVRRKPNSCYEDVRDCSDPGMDEHEPQSDYLASLTPVTEVTHTALMCIVESHLRQEVSFEVSMERKNCL